MAALVTNAEVTTFLTAHGITTTYATTFIDSRINAAHAWLEKKLGRTYGLDTNTSARTYDGNGIGDLPIDACQDITGVADIDENNAVSDTYTTSDYRSYPYNEATKRLLRLHSGIWPRSERGNIQVTAKWGEGTAPADVKEAELNLAALSVLAGANLPTVDGSLEGAVKSYSTGVYEVQFKDGSGKNLVAEITGWQQFVDNVIEARKDKCIF